MTAGQITRPSFPARDTGSNPYGVILASVPGSLLQVVVTPISAILRAATGDCDPVYGGYRCGLLYFLVFYKKVMQSRRIFATVTGSPVV